MTDKEEQRQTDMQDAVNFELNGRDERRKTCPACGRDESCFTTTITSPDGYSWVTECKCGELIDED